MNEEAKTQSPVPVMQVNADGTALDPKSLFVRWWLGQEASTVILVAILLGGAYMTYWHVTTGAPESARRNGELFSTISKENNQAHREIAEKNNTAIKDAAVINAAAADKMMMTFERAMDRLDRRPPQKGEQ